MGRGSSRANGGRSNRENALVQSLSDNTNFDAFVKSNLKNKDFLNYGRENGMEEVKELWYQKRQGEELKDIHEMTTEEAIDAIGDSIPSSYISGWFRNADSEYKPKLVDSIMGNKGTLNAGLNIAYTNYKNDMEIKGE